MDGSEGPARERAIRKLEQVWASIGFKHYSQGVWVLDPGLVDLRDAVTRMSTNFGIH